MRTSRRISLAYRLGLSVVAIALAVMIVLMAGIGIYSYQRQVRGIEQQVREVAALNVPQLTADVWDFADLAVQEQVEALKGLDHVAYVRLETQDGIIQEGEAPAGDAITRRFPLSHSLGGRLGELTIEFSLKSVRSSVAREALSIFLTVLAPFLVMASATLLLFRRLVTRHLDALAVYARGLTMDTLRQSFRFDRHVARYADELDTLLAALDTMRENLLQEISSRELAENELVRTELKYQQVFDSTGDAIFIHAAGTGAIVDVNRAMTEMYGLTREEALAVTISDISAGVEPFTGQEAMRRLALAHEGLPQIFEWLARRKDGSTFWVEVFLKRMEPEDEGRILAAVRDIAQRKAAEEQLRHIQRLDSIGQLSGGIAHDFNNMLTGIQGAAELILMDEPAEELRENAELILDTSRRAADLTAKLLAFSRKGGMVMALTDVHGVIRSALAILERSIDKRITVEADLAAVDSVAHGDAAQLQSVILNLGLNARDAMPDGGRLQIATRNLDLDADDCAGATFDLNPGRYLEITTTDDGVGMDEKTLSHALEPFFTTKSVGQGTGLGLSAVYGTIKEHSGEITIESAPGRGTEIRLLLPVVAAEVPATVGLDELVAGAGCILVIDDEDFVRELSARSLRRTGYRVLTASDGKNGLDVFAAHQNEIDLVVLDMVMPVMYGYDVFRALREREPQQRILLASGFSDDKLVHELLEEPHCRFLKKPFGPGDLTRAVAELLREATADR